MKRNLKHRALAMVSVILLCLAPLTFAQNKGPVKIGFIGSYTGPFAKSGIDMDHGFRLALDQAGFKAGGRQVEMDVADDETKPELGPTRARKLIENDHVQIIAGLDHSGVALSIRDIVVNHKIPTVITTAGEVSLTNGKLKSPYIFRTSAANMQRELPAGWYAFHKMGMKRMALIAPDYTAGHQIADGFKKYFVASGGQIVDEIYAPIDTNDFSPYLTKLAGEVKSLDGVWTFYPPGACIRLITQYQEYGLKQKLPLFALGDTVEASVLSSMKDAALGVKSYSEWADTMQTPENQAFVKAYLAKYKEYPSIYSERGYVGARVILMALDAVKGNVENHDAFLAAMRKVKFISPNGPFRFDANQNVILTVNLREVKKVDGRYDNVVLGTIATDVDQDWSPPKGKK